MRVHVHPHRRPRRCGSGADLVHSLQCPPSRSRSSRRLPRAYSETVCNRFCTSIRARFETKFRLDAALIPSDRASTCGLPRTPGQERRHSRLDVRSQVTVSASFRIGSQTSISHTISRSSPPSPSTSGIISVVRRLQRSAFASHPML